MRCCCGWLIGGDAKKDAGVLGHVQAVGDPAENGQGPDLLLAVDDGADPALGQHGCGGDPGLGDAGFEVQQPEQLAHVPAGQGS